MPFAAKSGPHSIIEAVFGLQFARPFTPAEVDTVVGSHEEWKEFLPRLARSGQFQIMIGSFGAAPPPAPIAGGVNFERVRPDGGLAWRLRIDGNAIYLNCLEYSQWKEVWPTARHHIRRVCELVSAEDNPAVSAVMQYIDVFEWHGDIKEYDASALLKAGQLVPESVLTKGPFWHLHQGWFRSEQRLGEGRVLERLHIDALEDEMKRPTIKLDSYLQYQFGTPASTLQGTFLNDDGAATAWFATLHDLDKELLGQVLTDDMVKQIGLLA